MVRSKQSNLARINRVLKHLLGRGNNSEGVNAVYRKILQERYSR